MAAAAATAPTIIRALAERRPCAAVVLAYHDVLPAGERATGWSVSPDLLRRHIRLVRRLGYTLTPLAELTRRAAEGRVAGLAAIAFDDALVGVHHHGLPVLAEESAPATLFAVSDAVGSDPPWWPGSQRLMTEAELRDAIAAGLDLGAHTRTHPSLPSLDDRALRAEVEGGRQLLSELGGRTADLFAYPYGHHDPRVRAAVAAAGYLAAYTFLNGHVTGREDPQRLPRLTAGPRLTPARLAYHLARPASSWPDHQADTVLDGFVT